MTGVISPEANSQMASSAGPIDLCLPCDLLDSWLCPMCRVWHSLCELDVSVCLCCCGLVNTKTIHIKINT